jgi:hypothetical protein
MTDGPTDDKDHAEPDKTTAQTSCEQRRDRLPDIDFSTFILSLSSSALIHLGEMPDTESHSVAVNLPMAKQTIDILGIIQDKTRGNLTKEEDRLLTELLYDLRLKFVSACKRGE